MRDRLQPEAGGSLPVPCGLYMAVGGEFCTRSRDISLVPDRTMRGGSRKSEEQHQWEVLDALCRRWMDYEKSLAIMGDSRNSYSKTDSDATLMRMKDDHMKNGQFTRRRRQAVSRRRLDGSKTWFTIPGKIASSARKEENSPSKENAPNWSRDSL